MPKIEKTLAEYIGEAITKDYLLTIAITSYTQAKYQTANLPFGLGKTTLGMELAYLVNGGSPRCWDDKRIWKKVQDIMVYNPYALAEMLKPSTERKPVVIWDDPQATAPASQSVPTALRQLANFISTERPEVALIILTTPNLNYIAAPLRKLVNFEIIISERGLYEVHKISYYKDFKRPLQDKMHFDYVDEVKKDEPFPRLPEYMQQWYNQWRIEKKLELYPNMLKNLKTYTSLQQWTEGGDGAVKGINELAGRFVTSGGRTVFVPNDQTLALKLHGKNMSLLTPPSQ
jgi:hypothetical protein